MKIWPKLSLNYHQNIIKYAPYFFCWWTKSQTDTWSQNIMNYIVISKNSLYFVCLFGLRLYIPVNNFQSCRDVFRGWTSTKQWRWSVLLKDTTPRPWWDSNLRPCDQESGTLPSQRCSHTLNWGLLPPGAAVWLDPALHKLAAKWENGSLGIQTQTGLYSHGRWLEARNFRFRKKRDCTIC